MGVSKRITLKIKKQNSTETPKPIEGIKSEGDFIGIISKELTKSKRCKLCTSFRTTERGNYFCSNFEAMWHHRDTKFSSFASCSFFVNK